MIPAPRHDSGLVPRFPPQALWVLADTYPLCPSFKAIAPLKGALVFSYRPSYLFVVTSVRISLHAVREVAIVVAAVPREYTPGIAAAFLKASPPMQRKLQLVSLA